ncbi:phage repressor protein CI [Vibrio rumoiensis]|uniref:phage repressor protein CI n=1 Tax=Vibrio rumoiensis TaxID=76258 RepID=UPI003AA82C25
MSELQIKFHSFEYSKGREVTERMKKITETSDFKTLGESLGISKGTISTWYQRELTPYEVIIRLHLHTGVSIRWLALGEGEPFPTKSEANVRDGQGSYQYLDKFRESKKLFDVDTFILKNGHIDRVGTLAIDNDILIENGVTNLMAIKEIGVTYFIDKEVQTATNGLYLINMDGVFSLNTLQRLPDNKLAIDFNGSSIEVNDSDIKVAGKVVFELNKK